jgi:S1-C subfamily serine protease
MQVLPLVLGLMFAPNHANGARPQESPEPVQRAAAAIKKSLGVEFSILESQIRRSVTSTKTPYGFKIREVEKNSTAAKAGWKEGDILLEWNGQPVRQLDELETAIQKSNAGGGIKVKLARYKKDAPALSRQPWVYIDGSITPK